MKDHRGLAPGVTSYNLSTQDGEAEEFYPISSWPAWTT